jgi:3-isopropylmalate dehydrogenase
MFDYSLGMAEAAQRIESVIQDCVSNAECTRDLGGTLTTGEAGSAVRRRLRETQFSEVAQG